MNQLVRKWAFCGIINSMPTKSASLWQAMARKYGLSVKIKKIGDWHCIGDSDWGLGLEIEIGDWDYKYGTGFGIQLACNGDWDGNLENLENCILA